MPESQINQLLHMQERGLHYGDGLFETLLKLDGEIPLWDSHYSRLQKGCNRLHIPIPGEQWLRQKIDAETSTEESVVIKVIVTRGIGGRGLELPKHNQASVFILKAHETTKIQVKIVQELPTFQLRFKVLNAITAPGEHPEINIMVE